MKTIDNNTKNTVNEDKNVYVLYNPQSDMYWPLKDYMIAQGVFAISRMDKYQKRNMTKEDYRLCDDSLSEKVEPNMFVKRRSRIEAIIKNVNDLMNHPSNGAWKNHAKNINKYVIIKEMSLKDINARYEEYEYYEYNTWPIKVKDMKNNSKCLCCGLIMGKRYNNVHKSISVDGRSLCYVCAEEAVNAFKGIPKPEIYDKMVESRFLHRFENEKDDDEW